MRRPKALDWIVKRTSRRFLTRLYRVTHRIPIKLREIEQQRVLVIAPHSDDEVIGAGGTLALHQERGSEVAVLYVTSDAHAPTESDNAARMLEARRVADLLGFEPHFLGMPDTRVSLHETRLAQLLREHLQARKPDVVICPFPGDHHRDHQATVAALIQALEGADFRGEVWCYEIWSTLWPNTGVDITRFTELKRQAINVYESQTRYMPYADSALGLNRYRGLRVHVPYAEAFYVCTVSELAELADALSTI